MHFGATDHEEIIYNATNPGTCYLHVYMQSGTNSSCTLWWDDIWQGE
jgi:hypothetical protein